MHYDAADLSNFKTCRRYIMSVCPVRIGSSTLCMNERQIDRNRSTSIDLQSLPSKHTHKRGKRQDCLEDVAVSNCAGYSLSTPSATHAQYDLASLRMLPDSPTCHRRIDSLRRRLEDHDPLVPVKATYRIGNSQFCRLPTVAYRWLFNQPRHAP